MNQAPTTTPAAACNGFGRSVADAAGSVSRHSPSPWRPLGQDTGGEQGQEDTADSSAADAREQSEPVRVLVVDDQPDVLDTTVELFKIMGYEVLPASNGADAVTILQNNPDLQVLFSDVVMPGMNGVALAREARRLIPGIQVILASGFHAAAVGQIGSDLHEFHFLPKPFRMADVAKVLRK